jgi:hypothetical protein
MHRNSMLTTGRDATVTFEMVKDGKAFSWAKHNDASGLTVARVPRSRGMAFDAAGSSGWAFLQSSLELINPKLVDPLQQAWHERDMPVKLGGGYPEFNVAWASNYGSPGTGIQGFQGTNTTDVAVAQADVEKGTWPTVIWAQAFNISYFDMQRYKTAERAGNQPPFTFQRLYEDSVKTVWIKDLDNMAYFGYLGWYGLCNNPNVSATVVVNGVSGHTQWAQKTANEILNDINFGILQTVVNSGYNINRGCADTLLLPFTQFNLLTNTMAVGTTNTAISILEYVKRNCAATAYFGGNPDRFKIQPLPNPFISGQGITNTAAQNAQGNGYDRAVFYRREEECINMPIPTPMEPAMTVPSGMGYKTYFGGCIGVPVWLRSNTVAYLDAI